MTLSIEKISNEGAEIYCERRGNGPLVLMIHGAMEDSGYYSSAADILADRFTVVSYDRRCNSRSSGDRSVDMSIAQQARDAASIIKHMGDGRAVVIGRSGGAIIGLELAVTMPEVIDFLIVYEAPVIEILSKSDAEKWRSFVNNIYRKSQHEGSHVAQTEFMESLINVPNSPLPPDLNDRISGNVAFFFDHEFRSFFGYMPNIEIIRKNSINMVTAVGQESNDAYYVQATKVLANKLDCEIIEFPGHHDLSLWMPKEFANAIQNTLERYRYQQGHET